MLAAQQRQWGLARQPQPAQLNPSLHSHPRLSFPPRPVITPPGSNDRGSMHEERTTLSVLPDPV